MPAPSCWRCDLDSLPFIVLSSIDHVVASSGGRRRGLRLRYELGFARLGPAAPTVLYMSSKDPRSIDHHHPVAVPPAVLLLMVAPSMTKLLDGVAVNPDGNGNGTSFSADRYAGQVQASAVAGRRSVAAHDRAGPVQDEPALGFDGYASPVHFRGVVFDRDTAESVGVVRCGGIDVSATAVTRPRRCLSLIDPPSSTCRPRRRKCLHRFRRSPSCL